MPDIAVVDYGMGNLRSVAKAIEHVAPGRSVAVTSDPGVIRSARRVVFPGQGAMPDCMREMDARGLRAPLLEAADSKPFLGLCIGLQMLFESSEEGDVRGLGILPGRVVRFPASRMVDDRGGKLKVPHMRWNRVFQTQAHPVWAGIPDGSRFYFVHSYYVECGDPRLIMAESRYPFGFTCAVARNNIFAVQFHPEKSQSSGLQLLSNFVRWDGSASGNGETAMLGVASA
jgi:imidazole glycerol-phosphate synthase subunit HisH